MTLFAQHSSSATNAPRQVGWLLLAVMTVLPWLMPIHRRPWTSFHAELLMALVVLAAIAVIALSGGGRWRWPPLALGMLAFAAIPFLQSLVGLLPFPEDAAIAVVHLLGLSLAIAAGQRATTHAPGRLEDALLSGMAVAAFVSLVFACVQWLQLDGWDAIVMGVQGRPVANVAQSNKLALLFLWGLVAVWAAHAQGQLRGGWAVVVAALLIFGVVMTQSRMGTFGFVGLAVIAVLKHKALQTGHGRYAIAALFLWFIACQSLWTPLNSGLGLMSGEALLAREVGTRPIHWSLASAAILDRPWMGWGWLQVTAAQGAHAADFPATWEVLSSAHNLVLDLLIWNGIPLGMIAAGGLTWWFISAWRHAHDVRTVCTMTVITLFLWHSMVEMPHTSALILLPVGLLAGTVQWNQRHEMRLPLAVPIILWVVIAVWLVILARDYFRVEEAVMAERMRRARIGDVRPQPLPSTLTLDHLAEAHVAVSRIPLDASVTPEDFAKLQSLVGRFPSVHGLLLLARFQALNGEAVEATRTLRRLCNTNPPHLCTWAKGTWVGLASSIPALRDVELPKD